MRRRKMKKQKQIVIISSLCLVLCLCVGYAAFQTTLSMKAKGNIKELPNCEMGGIKVNTVTDGDGLYKDIYEEERCVYRGQNPDNYKMFNDELWRIIAKETDGTYKIIKNDVLATREFDVPTTEQQKIIVIVINQNTSVECMPQSMEHSHYLAVHKVVQ